jgi:hypothetical protein
LPADCGVEEVEGLGEVVQFGLAGCSVAADLVDEWDALELEVIEVVDIV